MAHYPNFIGGSYESASPGADAQRTINLYPEAVESGAGKNRVILRGTPGLQTWLELPEHPIRGLYEANGKVWAVAGQVLYEITNGAMPLGTAQYPVGPPLKAAIAAEGAALNAAGANFDSYPLGTADQWAFCYAVVTEHIPPLPEEYGFGTNGTLGRFDLVTLDTWWAAFTAVGPNTRLVSSDVLNDYQPIVWTDNGRQLLFISGGRAWIVDMYDPTGTATMVELPDISSGTDLVVDGTNDRLVTSVSSPFTNDMVLLWVDITGGGGWTAGRYQIVSVDASGAALLDHSPAATSTTGGTFVIPSQNYFISCGFCDGYFLLVDKNSQRFRVSGLYDGTSWAALDVGSAEGDPDNLVQMAIDHGDVWLFGRKSIEVWVDTGNADFPFQRNPGAYIQQGLEAQHSVCVIDNAMHWIGGDSRRGGRVAWRAAGFQPQRISTHAVETAWSKYETCEDAISWTYETDGHAFWVISFPTADKTWVYDTRTGLWHERAFWDDLQVQLTRSRARCHVWAFRKHLVGDRLSGKIFWMDESLYDDDGIKIARIRRAPHLCDEEVQMFYHRFQLDLDSGEIDNPEFILRWSNDSGRTWSKDHIRTAGPTADYKHRVIWNRPGSGRDRIFEVASNAAMRHAWIDAYLQFTKGIS